MALVLAIEPDSKQAAVLKWVVEDRLRSEFVLTDSKEAAIAAVDERIPDLILVSALLSPRDEAEFSDHLRSLDAEHLQTLTIPLLGSTADGDDEPGRGLLGGFLRRRKVHAPAGCDPSAYADELKRYLKLAIDERDERAARLKWQLQEQEFTLEVDRGQPMVAAVPPSDPQDSWGHSLLFEQEQPEATGQDVLAGTQNSEAMDFERLEELAWAPAEPIVEIGEPVEQELISTVVDVSPAAVEESAGDDQTEYQSDERAESPDVLETVATEEQADILVTAPEVATNELVEEHVPSASFEVEATFAVQRALDSDPPDQQDTPAAVEVFNSPVSAEPLEDLDSADQSEELIAPEPMVAQAAEPVAETDSLVAFPLESLVDSQSVDPPLLTEDIEARDGELLAPSLESHDAQSDGQDGFVPAEAATVGAAEDTLESSDEPGFVGDPAPAPLVEPEPPVESPVAAWNAMGATTVPSDSIEHEPAEPSLDRVIEDLIRPFAASFAPVQSITIESVEDPTLDPIVSQESARQMEHAAAPIERQAAVHIEAWAALPAWADVGPPLASHISVGARARPVVVAPEPVVHAAVAKSPEPTKAPESAPDAIAIDSRWIATALDALRSDIQMLRAERPVPAEPSSAAAQAAAPPAAPESKPQKPAAKAKAKKQDSSQPVDEWGFYDPTQCGFEALFAAIDAKEAAEAAPEEELFGAADLLINEGSPPAPAVEQLIVTPSRRTETVRLAPLAMWAHAERDADPESSSASASAKRHDDLSELLGGLAIPVSVASVSYPTGCHIRRVRMTRDDQPRPPKAAEDPVIILSRRLLKKERDENTAAVRSGRR